MVLFLYSYIIVYRFDQAFMLSDWRGFLNKGIIVSGIFVVLENQRIWRDSFSELAQGKNSVAWSQSFCKIHPLTPEQQGQSSDGNRSAQGIRVQAARAAQPGRCIG